LKKNQLSFNFGNFLSSSKCPTCKGTLTRFKSACYFTPAYKHKPELLMPCGNTTKTVKRLFNLLGLIVIVYCVL